MRCPVCGADNLSPLGQLQSYRTRLTVVFGRVRTFKARPQARIGFARVCLDCGAVIPFVGAGERRRLLDEPELRPVQDVTGRHYDEETGAWSD
jgi:hypothetical protein